MLLVNFGTAGILLRTIKKGKWGFDTPEISENQRFGLLAGGL